ncbi:nuclease-related domain-containing protein [Anaerobacillus sp. MEB173]|uniref:nuclease-related domain-containing protein n=1 Tax=Anaerobacillus sp. MEB173 TaxID=3383345 RepID=UPI003F907751
MIKKEQKPPLKIVTLEALLRRIPLNHPQREKITQELKRRKAGYRGEQLLNYHLSFLSPDKFMIFHDVRLTNDEKYYFQLDILLLTQYYCLILEVKNISGELYFDQNFNQLIRTSNEKSEAFEDPILQVKRQETQLQTWLAKNKLPSIPLHSFIVISNPATIIKTDPEYKSISKKVIHAASLPTKIEALDQYYKNEIVTSKELKKLSRLLLKHHTPFIPELQVQKSEILSGVHCPHCHTLSLIRYWGKWFCPCCKTMDKDAHLSALEDYSLLIGSTITNKQCRDFLHISYSVASKLLASLDLEYSGRLKGRKYHLRNDRLR